MWVSYLLFWLFCIRTRQKSDKMEQTEHKCVPKHVLVMEIKQQGVLKPAEVMCSIWLETLTRIHGSAVTECFFQVDQDCHPTRNFWGDRYLKLRLLAGSVQVFARTRWRVLLLPREAGSLRDWLHSFWWVTTLLLRVSPMDWDLCQW